MHIITQELHETVQEMSSRLHFG